MTSPASHARDLPHEIAHAADEFAHLVERALQLPEPPDSWWHRAGVPPRAERWLEVVSSLVLALVTIGWIWTIVDARAGGRTVTHAGETEAAVTPATRSVTAALTTPGAPTAAYLADAALQALVPLRGTSGRVRVVMQEPGDTLPTGVTTAPSPQPGIVQLAIRVRDAVRPVTDLSVVRLTPLSARKGGRIGLYYIGAWPTEGRGRATSGPAARGDYAPPRGLIEVTPENQNLRLSEHLRLKDFLTHNQANVWPKYVVVNPRIIDKDELVLADLRARGIDTKGFYVMSGFRTPSYNAGGGNTAGRASLSRHMFGDANDVWIDSDGDGRMDDLNRDGRVDMRDSQVICAAVGRVEQAHPALVGGCGIYPGNGAHGPFAHIDARGYRARWTGGPNGG